MESPTIPDKELFHVAEVVWIIAPYLGRSTEAVKRSIYRKIEDGTISARVHLGRTMVPRAEIQRIIEGEPV